MAQVDHPTIVKLLAAYEDDKNLYMVMELVAGGEVSSLLFQLPFLIQLNKLLATSAHVEEDKVQDIMRPLFDAVVYCHKLQIIHRDIKLENILLTSDDSRTEQVKITDFGLSKSLGGEKFTTTICGSPGYIAPEILSETPYDQKADFWSLGVVIYVLLTGEPPFFHENCFELYELIKKGAIDLN